MTIWRMAMRCGSGGHDMSQECIERGVAAITYSPLEKVNLSKFPKGKPPKQWGELESTQKVSLRRVAYEMKKGDTIYVKRGRVIVGRGKVLGGYQFDDTLSLCDPDGTPWSHQVPVDWEADFVPVEVLLGSELTTVLPLEGDRLEELNKAMGAAKAADKHRRKQESVLEGDRYRAEATFRRRNRALIEAKKGASDGRCELCGNRLTDRYVGLKKDCLEAHHVKPIGDREKQTKTRIEDIFLLCPNCHTVVHSTDPPLSLDRARKMVRER